MRSLLVGLGAASLAFGLAGAPAIADDLEACAVEPLVAGGGGRGAMLAGRVLADSTRVVFDTRLADDYYFGTHRGHFDISGAWDITEVHVAVSCEADETLGYDFPVARDGNPKVGRFEYGEKHLAPGTQEVEVYIDASACGDQFYVAAHARLSMNDGATTESAWAIELPFQRLTGADSWAQYFQVDQLACNDHTTPPAAPPNGRPVANPDSYQVQQDTPLVVDPKGVLANDTDPDGDPLEVFSAPCGTDQSGGVCNLLWASDGSFTYTPAPGFVGTDSFIYVATDGNGLYSDPAKVVIRVTKREVTQPPVVTELKCSRCSGLDCLLDSNIVACDAGQDLCYTRVDDSNGVVRTIARNCASQKLFDDLVEQRDPSSNSVLPVPAEPSDHCKNVEVALLGAGTTCVFYCDPATKEGCNNPPSLIPTEGREPPW